MWFVPSWVWAWVPFWNSLVKAGQRHRRNSGIQPPGVGQVSSSENSLKKDCQQHLGLGISGVCGHYQQKQAVGD